MNEADGGFQKTFAPRQEKNTRTGKRVINIYKIFFKQRKKIFQRKNNTNSGLVLFYKHFELMLFYLTHITLLRELNRFIKNK